MNLDHILKLLGGDTAVKAELGLRSVSTISNWRTRGLPSGRKFDLLSLAAKKNLPISISDLDIAQTKIRDASEERIRSIKSEAA